MINFSKIEEEILKFWADQKIFNKSLEKDSPLGDFAFYDGPPFATGTPHYGHLLAGTIKDVIPRFKTMQGFHVARRWGWDCHGLPIENIIEQKLNLKSRKDIEVMGIDKFCEACRSEVLRYADEWRKVVERTGRWVDMDNDYRTMNPDYMESIWWVFKSLWDKDLIYEGYKSMHICPRCETTLSNFEVTQNYKELKDISVTVKFELIDEPGTFLLAWTTTPWTLPGNVALAVNPEIKYIKIKIKRGAKKGDTYIYSANKKYDVFKNSNVIPLGNLLSNGELIEGFAEISTIGARELVGKKYKPLFDYYTKDDSPAGELENHKNGWQVYAADFVATDEGTGIVHIAPAFGEDDMNLGKEKNLPFIQHVDMTGRFKSEVTDWAGELVKAKDDPQGTDNKIVSWLKENKKLFSEEKIEHSYPLCWRCDTPLLNYAARSWFVKVTDLKDKLIKNNKEIAWVPEHMKEGRFGKWLEQAKDWAISRNRFWGAPLPVWRCEQCHKDKVIGSVEELKEQTNNLITKIILVRHGESEKNVEDIFDAQGDDFNLTKNGQELAKVAGEIIKNEKVAKIFHSPMLRVRETAEIINKEFNLPLTPAPELTEIGSGNWEDKARDDQSIQASRAAYKALTLEDQYAAKRGETGESWKDCEDRIYNFVKKIIKENPGQTIVLVTHQAPLVYLLKALKNLTMKEAVDSFELENIKKYAWPITVFIDNRHEKQIDLHKHRIDDLVFECPNCHGQMKRIPDVLDCWFESGAMPYGQAHYPFENKDKFEKNFPAQFIAEGQDQTRGWFYTLLVLSTALFNKPAYLNVIANGLVLAEDGKKMSKRLKNYPEPMEVMDKFGADMMRYYLVASPAVKAEELRFNEKDVRELYNKIDSLLWNIFTFYKLFEDKSADLTLDSDNILDKWIKAKTNVLINEVTTGLETYDLMKATKPIADFINEFSTWYLRRSRDRFKSENKKDKEQAQATLYQCLFNLVKVMAPFTPFITDKIYQELGGTKESVHLEDWPKGVEITKDEKVLLEEMDKIREAVRLGLSARSLALIKVKQPLSLLYVSISGFNFMNKQLIKLVKDEINVLDVQPIVDQSGKVFKRVREIVEVKDGQFKGKYAEDYDGQSFIALKLDLTTDLIEQGLLREFIRAINNLRKEADLTINDRVDLLYQTKATELKKAIDKFKSELLISTKSLSIEEISETDLNDQPMKELVINEVPIKFVLNKK